MKEFEALAKRLADEAGEIARKYFRTPFEVISKDDDSPVTIADREIEARMREILEDERPQDGIYGEEHGIKQSESGLTWVLDPIDGTKSFVIGRPTFGTLIALCDDGKPKLGVIDQPITKERWIGFDGQTTFNGERVKTAALESERIGGIQPQPDTPRRVRPRQTEHHRHADKHGDDPQESAYQSIVHRQRRFAPKSANRSSTEESSTSAITVSPASTRSSAPGTWT